MTQQIVINVKHVDNRLVIFFNGENIWDSGIVYNDPALDVNIDLTPYLLLHQHEASELIFEGYNDSFSPYESGENPWHFEYRVVVQQFDDEGGLVQEADLVKPYNEWHLSNPNIRAINNKYRIVKKADDFIVLAHSLTQNFMI
jgi:hypothetical protein